MGKLKPFDKIEIIRRCTGITSTQKLILLTIATHLGKNDFAYVGLNTLKDECCLVKKSALTKNLSFLIDIAVLWKLPPSDGFKSNRYGINFDLLVTHGHYMGDLRSLEGSPTVTTLVTSGHPKRTINKSKRNKRENPVNKINGKAKDEAIQEIRKLCGIRRH